MVLLLDTDDIPVADRPSALEAVFAVNEAPQRVRYGTEPGRVKHRLELFRYGPGVHLLRNTGSGLLIDRTRRHVALGAPEQLAVGFQRRGLGNLAQGESRQVYRAGDLMLTPTAQPYSWRSGRMDHFVLLIDNPELGMSTEQLLLAGPRLAVSPLYPLARAYFSSLCTSASDLDPEAMAALGRATAELLRAAIITAIGAPGTADLLEQTLFSRMAGYATARLHDPELSADQIAAQHHISVRHLYTVWLAKTGQSPGRWIMTQRLDRAAALLTGGGGTPLPIGLVARRCGFTNVSHFSRRFRAAFGVPPSRWSAARRQS